MKIKIRGTEIAINKDVIKITIKCIVSLLLMLIIPSISNTVILAIVYGVISIVKMIQNQERRIMKLICIYGSLFIVASFMLGIFVNQNEEIKERVNTSFHPEMDPMGSGYVGMLQKEILENVKVMGETKTSAISDKNSIINMKSNYTFIYFLGKMGIVITGILVLVVVLTSVRLITNAKKIKEPYGKFLIIGFSIVYVVRSFATILMNLNMGIQTNVNLPFMTYEGVDFIVDLLSIVMILSIYRRKDISEYDREYKRRVIKRKLEESD